MIANSARNRYLRAILGVFVVALVSAGVILGIERISRTPTSQPDGRPLVLATVPHIASWLNSIGGQQIRVETIVPQGLEVHDFSFSATSVTQFQDAVLLAANGAGLESWLPELETALPDLPVVDTTAGLPVTTGDPHTWLNPILATQQIEILSQALQDAIPSGAARFQLATTQLVEEINAFDAQAQTAIDALPQRRFVALHNAFSYFSRRYGLEQVGTLVELPGDEPTFADVDELRASVEQFHLTTLFVEPGPVSDVAKNLANELHLQLKVLDPLETIQPDAGTYLAGLRNDLEVLVD